jgi:hypothetical protein
LLWSLAHFPGLWLLRILPGRLAAVRLCSHSRSQYTLYWQQRQAMICVCVCLCCACACVYHTLTQHTRTHIRTHTRVQTSTGEWFVSGPDWRGGTAVGYFFVSARTHKRHHHQYHQFLIGNQKLTNVCEGFASFFPCALAADWLGFRV